MAILERSPDVSERRTRYLGQITVNEGEYGGLILVLDTALEIGLGRGDGIRIYGDSMLVVMQTLGKWRVKEPRLMKLRVEAHRLASQLRSSGCSVSIAHVKRDRNKAADELVGRFLDDMCR